MCKEEVRGREMKKLLVIGSMVLLLSACWVKGVLAVMPDDYSARIAASIEFAEEQATLEAYGSAIDTYWDIIELDPKAEYYIRLGDLYSLSGQEDEAIDTFRKCMEVHPENEMACQLLIAYYYEGNNLSECQKYIEHYATYHGWTEELIARYYECKYPYEIKSGAYAEACDYFGDKLLVKDDVTGYWMYLNKKFKSASLPLLEDASPKFGDLLGVTIEGNANFIDVEGAKYLDTTEQYDKTWSFLSGLALVEYQGKFGYVNSRFELVLKDYEDATNFVQGVAAVKTEKGWQLLYNTGQPVNEKYYQDVKYDEYRLCSMGGRIFVQEENSYILLDTAGKQLGENVFEDVKPFFCGKYAAAKQGGLWGYIDMNGAWVIEPQYEDAQSFGEDLGAVCIDGKWGFINEKGRVIIEPQYDGAKHLREGVVPVKQGNWWYYLNVG